MTELVQFILVLMHPLGPPFDLRAGDAVFHIAVKPRTDTSAVTKARSTLYRLCVVTFCDERPSLPGR